MKKLFYTTICALFIFLFTVPVYAATIAADSCSQAHVAAAISTAVTGDLVTVPSGTCTWTLGVSLAGKTITLQGAGIGQTVITTGAFTAVTIATSGSRVTGFEFNFSSSSGIGIIVNHTGWRVDHCEFDFRPAGAKGLAIAYTNRNLYYIDPSFYEIGGLVDNNYFYDARNTVNGSAYALHANGCAYHAATLDLGGDTAVYFEDNTFNSARFGNIMDGNRSGAYVFRYNTVVKTGSGGSVVEAHSLQSDAERGTKKWEVYRNDITHGSYETMLIRGGTGIIFDNTVTGGTDEQIRFNNVRDTSSVGTAGLCDGTNGNWDSNEGSGGDAGWKCRDQVGSGSDSSAYDGSLPLPTQNKVPVYLWSNGIVPDSDHVHMSADRDYYTEDAGFDGTSGVGVGVLAAIPGTCTTGVGYWATDQGSWNNAVGGDQGVLYKCTSTDTWEVYYTPYTYPHPLQGGTAIPSGTVVVEGGLVESDIVAGEKTLVITLTDDTGVATVGYDNAITTALIAGIDSDKAEATGWDAVVKAGLTHEAVTRTSDTVITIVLPAFGAYNITASETITVTIPPTAVTSATEIVATPSFVISVDTAPAVQTMTGVYDATGITGLPGDDGHTVIP